MTARCRFCGLTFIGGKCWQAMADHTWVCDDAQDFIRSLTEVARL